MALHVYSSVRIEALAALLAQLLKQQWPEDPFAPVPIVVGSRGMERWLRHTLADALGAVSGLDFPFPGPAFDGAALAVLPPDAHGQGHLDAAYWRPSAARQTLRGPWSGAGLTFRVLLATRRLAADPAHEDAFRRVGDYLRVGLGAPVTPRELGLAAELGDCLDRLMHHRPAEALAWARDPGSAPEAHRWLAVLLATLTAELDTPPSPAASHEALWQVRPAPSDRPFYVFGLSTLSPGERMRLEVLARFLDIHYFLLVPSLAWLGDLRSVREQRRELATLPFADLREAREDEFRHQNPILTNFGMPSRELQTWLLEVPHREFKLAPELPDSPHFLHALQRWVADAGAPTPTFTHDDSVSFHATHGALRQCEVLRDVLLGLFADASLALSPRDVLVMTPDVATFAPLVSAVFARRGEGEGHPLPAIPTHIADLGLRRTNPLAELLLEVLALARERVTASALIAFVSQPVVMARFGVGHEDLADLRDLVITSGLRWAWDATDRAGHDQPALDQNTVRFAVERMALGMLMPAPEPLTSLPATGGLGPTVPLPVHSRERAGRFGKFVTICRALDRAREVLAAPAIAQAWRERLSQTLARFAPIGPRESAQRADVEARLATLLPDFDGLALEREAVVRLIETAFDESIQGDRPITGAVTVCALEPLRSVPFKVIALLGMDEGSFPRVSRLPGWDPFTTRRRGELDRRDIDRHLILEALMSARERFICLYTGLEARSNKPQAGNVIVEELIDITCRLTGKAREDLIAAHPRQPWSRANFESDTARSFDAAMARSAAELASASFGDKPHGGLRDTTTDGLPAADPTTLGCNELGAALAEPQKHLLKDRLGVDLEPWSRDLEDREPIELKDLALWQVKRQLVDAVTGRGRTAASEIAGRDPETKANPNLPSDPEKNARFHDISNIERFTDEAHQRLAGEGALPLAKAGKVAIAEASEKLAEAWEVLDADGGVKLAAPLWTWRSPCGLEVSGQAPWWRVGGDSGTLEWVEPSTEVKAKAKLVAWAHLLLGVVASPVEGALRVVGARVVAVPGSKKPEEWRVRAPERAAAEALLADLVAVWRLVRERPVRLFEDLSEDLAKKLQGGDSASDVVTAESEKAWLKALEDRWVDALFHGRELATLAAEVEPWGLEAMAKRVWGPVVAHTEGQAKSRNQRGKS